MKEIRIPTINAFEKQLSISLPLLSVLTVGHMIRNEASTVGHMIRNEGFS